ncbi:hypothetical protein [Lacrimispora celerecrescens]|uniref:adenosine deaminase n=1 Tax=Lacrimispora celerecrescens TaxID=29354 RepID=A0A084JJZ8_9FIRM|nr:hypothetical protein [Lacrimispora celerecrescens]KEZ89282.1 hypothetical protein IO98_14950 [Lacrimispora celerecrescens]
METERICLELLLRRINYKEIELIKDEKDISYNRINEKRFLEIAKTALDCYSGDEIVQMYQWLKCRLEGTRSKEVSHGIFAYIANIAEHFLELKGHKFLCIEYAENIKEIHNLQLLRWRELSMSLGNDIFMAALLAKSLIEERDLTEWLCTPLPTFDINYKKDIGMVSMAENHFHLKGSIPVFTLNWVCLMNHIGDVNKTFFLHFDRFLDPQYHYEEVQQSHLKLMESCRQAAFYRMYLYHRLRHNNKLLENPIYRTMELEEADLSELQEHINVCRAEHENFMGPYKTIECFDYAVGDEWSSFISEEDLAEGKEDWEHKMVPKDEISIAGERYFLYCCFRAIFDDRFSYKEKNMFYRYLVICLRIRAEMIQVNGKRGFSNFAEYQDRKEDFIEDYPAYQDQIMNLAVKSLSRLQSISSMELRITPKDHIETLKRIAHYDKSMENSQLDFFYVLHFAKKRDTAFVDLKPRNYETRDYLDRQIREAYALLEAELFSYQYHGKIPRVRGYDTCAGEIGCRPEVFGQFYRQLQQYNYKCGLSQVHFTYHVGEDFLDIFSGLRAIDEVLRFCELPKNSRIGHGMVLGIDAKNYYHLKKNSSVLEKLEILDNVSWVLGFCQEHGIVIDKSVEDELQNYFLQYLNEIYIREETRELSEEERVAQHEAAITCEERTGERLGFMNYYNAWKLRGDRPGAYLNGECYLGADIMEECCYVDEKELESIRMHEVCRNYYRDYHFSKEVRDRGAVIEIWKVNERYYPLITKIQEELRLILTTKEIAVECNPSSNHLIGPFQRYEEHPILHMYGKNLSVHPSSRMNVSINTDDQGIFHTSLEMEYATMYTALLKSRDQQGILRYSKEDIQQWIKDIGEFGRQQVFRFFE